MNLQQLRYLAPGIKEDGLLGGTRFFDAVTDDAISRPSLPLAPTVMAVVFRVAPVMVSVPTLIEVAPE